jgi:hypothetical protein
VGLVVFREDDWSIVIEPFSNQVRYPKLLFDPQGHRCEKRSDPGGGIGKISLKKALKLDERLVVEGNVVEFVGRNPALLQTGLDGKLRKSMVVFLSAEALFLDGAHDLAVSNKTGGTVMIIS